MSVRLITGNLLTLADDLEDGQLGEIVDWSDEDSLGTIVQRYGNDLVVIGGHSDYGYSDFFEMAREEDLKVRVLESGDKLQVTDN